MALARARELDEYYEKTGEVVGSLHGVPVSLKDQLRVKVPSLLVSANYLAGWRFMHITQCRILYPGQKTSVLSAITQDIETSMGYIHPLGTRETASSESVLTRLLRNAGAVFYIKTTVPQGLMFCETYNNVTGRTVNPFNTAWTCGGSSGGEGALLGMRGGVLGIGTDIGLYPSPFLLSLCVCIGGGC